MNISIITLINRLSVACVCLLVWSHTVSAAVGEGQVSLDTSAVYGKLLNKYNYQVKVRFKSLDMKYRFFSILGEPGEVFIPRYELQEIAVYDIKTKKHQYTVTSNGFSQPDYISVAERKFVVSQQIMNSAIMTSLHFRLRLCTYFDNVEIQRRNPGVLFRGGEWGFDVAASPSWSSFANVSSSINEFDNWRSPKDARKAYLDLVSGDLRNCNSEAFDATFDIAPLVARISSVYPDAFNFTTAADKQMLSLIGQYEDAFRRGDDDMRRRQKLTDRAFDMLKADLSNTTKKLWIQTRNKLWLLKIKNKLADIGELSEGLNDDVTGGNFPEETAEALRDFNQRYSDKTLANAGLTGDFVQKLDKLQETGDRWLKIVPFKKNGWFGYRRPSNGKTIIKPAFTRAGAFSGGFAVVRNAAGWQVIDRTGDIVIGPSRERITRKNNEFIIDELVEEGCEFNTFLQVSFKEIYRYGRRRMVKSERSIEQPRAVTCVQEKQAKADQKTDQQVRLQKERAARTARLKREREEDRKLNKEVVAWINKKLQTPSLSCTRPATPRSYNNSTASRFQDRMNTYVRCKEKKLQKLAAYCDSWTDEEDRKSPAFQRISATKMTKSHDKHCVAKFDSGVESINNAQKSWKRYLKRYNAKQKAKRRDGMLSRGNSSSIILQSRRSQSSTPYSRSAGKKWKPPVMGCIDPKKVPPKCE